MIDSFSKDLGRLIEAFCQGDESAFDKIAFIIYQDIINIACMNGLSREEGKDVLQMVLLKIYKKMKTFKKKAKFSSWVYRITINASIDLIRKKKRVAKIANKYKEDMKREGNKNNLDLNYKNKIIKDKLNQLSDKQRNVFILRHFQKFPFKKISKIIGCSESTAKTHFFRAVNNLKEKMNLGG
jgi:RNA polymerase sigma-70 factor (ECF subfamily)